MKHEGHKGPRGLHEASHFLTRAPSDPEGTRGLAMSQDPIFAMAIAVVAFFAFQKMALMSFSRRAIAGLSTMGLAMSQEPTFVASLWVFVIFVFQPRARMLSRPQMPWRSEFETRRTQRTTRAPRSITLLHRKDRDDRKDHRKEHRIIDSSHHHGSSSRVEHPGSLK